ncbi:MAG: DNA internalization-related competence protein ComEC/Rec2 [Candidatus Binatia bacterium]|nr:MAG: DNA internalization-related competence protein ComEC/Rec2 [Candidatus Binatia bacterium]
MWRHGVTPAMLFAAGLLAGDGLAAAAPCTLPLWALALYCGSVGVVCRGPPAARALAVAAIGFLVGFVRASTVYAPRSFPPGHVAQLRLPDAYEVEARVRSGNLVTGRKATLVLDVLRVRQRGRWERATGRVRVTVYVARTAWIEGSVVRAFLKLRRPRNFGNPSEFDYEAHLARQGIWVTASAESDERWEQVGRAHVLFECLARWRRRVVGLFDATSSAREAAVMRALVVGDQSGIPPDLREAFSRVGVGHVLSISGLHVALVAGAGYLAARFVLSRSEAILLFWNVPKVAGAFALVPVVLYATIAGESVATRRAILMLAVFLGALLSNREAYFPNVLAVAAILVVLAAPGATGDISFQLSFVAVWALGRAARVFRSWWPAAPPSQAVEGRRWHWRRFAEGLARYVAASLWLSGAATAATAPFTAWHFYQVSLIAPVANLCLVPILGSLAVLFGLAAAFTEPWCRPLAAWFAYAGGEVVSWGCAGMERMARLPWVAVHGVSLGFVEIAAWFFALGVLLPAGRVGRAPLLAAAMVVLLVGGAVRVHQGFRTAALEVTVWSVGQANAALVRFPDGTRWMVDAGGLGDGGFDLGSRVIAPALWQRGVRSLEALVLTHPQFDHFGSMAALVRFFEPALFYHNGRHGQGARFQQLQARLASWRVRPVALYAGAERCFGGARVRVLHPHSSARSRNPNHDSLVLLLEFGGRTMLLPGDIEAEQEDALSEEWRGQPVDVLLVPHHGSRTSSTAAFVAATRPRLAVISAGWHNRFRFPHREVVRRYASAGSLVLRTDWDGAVDIRMDSIGRLFWRTTRPPWNRWHEEPLLGPRPEKFVDSTCWQG